MAATQIHPTAIIEPGAEIGEGCVIGPYACVGPQVKLGEGCTVHQHATLTGRMSLGTGNEVYPGAVLGGKPQDLKYEGEDTEVIIGDNNTFRECTTVNIGTAGGGGKTIIGNNCLIMAYAHVAHDCIIKDRVVIANCVQLAGHVSVEEGVVISGMAAVHHFTTIGRLSFVGGLSGVRQDVPPFMLVEGNPARPRGLNVVGLKRKGVSSEAVDALKKAYRTIYNSDLNRRQAVAQVAGSELAEVPEVAELLDSFKTSETGRHGRALEATRSTNGNGGMYRDKDDSSEA